MQRGKILSFALAAALCGAAALAAGPVAVVAVLPLALAVAVLPMLSASNPDAHRRTSNLPHWLTVALYRAECFGVRARNKLGAALFAWQARTGAILCAFPGSVTADLAFGIVGELAFDGPYRSTPARISHGTAADIVIGRFFTIAADGTARPGGTLAGGVASIAVDDGGSVYAATPKVSIVGGGGYGAEATATLAGGIVTAVTVNKPGQGYTSTPQVVFTTVGAAPTTPAAATATLTAAGAIGGVFMAPKTQASIGTSAGGPLAPTMTVPTGTVGEFCYMGSIVVAAPAAVAIGDTAKYNTTTGVIGVGAPGAGEAAIPRSKFVRYANAAAALAVLELTN